MSQCDGTTLCSDSYSPEPCTACAGLMCECGEDATIVGTAQCRDCEIETQLAIVDEQWKNRGGAAGALVDLLSRSDSMHGDTKACSVCNTLSESDGGLSDEGIFTCHGCHPGVSREDARAHIAHCKAPACTACATVIPWLRRDDDDWRKGPLYRKCHTPECNEQGPMDCFECELRACHDHSTIASCLGLCQLCDDQVRSWSCIWCRKINTVPAEDPIDENTCHGCQPLKWEQPSQDGSLTFENVCLGVPTQDVNPEYFRPTTYQGLIRELNRETPETRAVNRLLLESAEHPQLGVSASEAALRATGWRPKGDDS